MFRVDNADFIADKLAAELLPDQEYREAAKNSEEAVRRRLALGENASKGRIEFDVDWTMLAATGEWYISCADNGDGMDRAELEKYTTTLAVRGAGQNQAIDGNQGMGLKISGPTRHKEGLLIRSLKNGEATMVQVGWDKNLHQYGLIGLGDAGQVVVETALESFPQFVQDTGSGTVVTFLGNEGATRTFLLAGRTKGWLFKYLNQRFFRMTKDGIEMFVRVPSGDEEDWPKTRAEADTERMRGVGRSFNTTRVYGTAAVWDDAAEKVGSDSTGVVDLPGSPAESVPPARVYWWVLPTGPGSDVSSRTYGGGSIGLLFQNEVHDWRTSAQANPYFGRMGILFGKSRIGFVVEPLGSTVTSDFARAHVLVDGRPVFESDAWQLWADQFREAIPGRIKDLMLEEQSRLQSDDPDRAKRIRDRLKDVMSLLRPVRYRRKADGMLQATGPDVTGPGGDIEGTTRERVRSTGTSKPGSKGTRGIGSVLAQLSPDGDAATEIYSVMQLEPKWVTEKEAEDTAIVSADGTGGLRDRAAGLAGSNAATASILLLNKEFRGYTAIVNSLNEWANPEGDPSKNERIVSSVQEWIEQKMVEAVTGLRQLENGSSWTTSVFDDALSPAALTAAFMADRYHTLRETKRQIGSLRSTSAA